MTRFFEFLTNKRASSRFQIASLSYCLIAFLGATIPTFVPYYYSMETSLGIILDEHKELLGRVSKAITDRNFFSAYPEHPKAYPEDGAIKAHEWLNGQTGKHFKELMQNSEEDWCGDEVSPYLQELLSIKYPYFSPDTLVSRAKDVQKQWHQASVEARVAVLMDSLERVKTRFFDI